MRPINVKSAIKQSVYLSISLACFSFVLWQGVLCVEKYIDKAQATKLSLVHTSEIHQCPALTICAHDISNKYDKDHLNRCGLR